MTNNSLVGREISHYRVLGMLGAGGMGEVYRARDEQLGRDVALKVLPESLASDPGLLRRFEREARALAALNHPNIVTIHSVEEAGGVHFLTMELVEGTTLDELIPERGLPISKLLDLAVALADALHAAHEHGVVHRDLKPANVMVDARGRPKILDFGLALLLQGSSGQPGETEAATASLGITRQGHIVGTYPYMSPEQARGEIVDQRSDIFSLGVILFEMASGRRPFGGDTPTDTASSILRDQPPRLEALRPGVPGELARIVHHCLRKEPDKRYQTALDLRNELDELRAAEAAGTQAGTTAGPRRHGRTTALRVAVVIVAVVVAVIAGRRWLRPSGERGPGSAPPRVAVLPFENLGPEEEAYFATGITDEITGRLALVSGLSVISRASAAAYDRRGKSVVQIAHDLGVGYLLVGSIRWQHVPEGSDRVCIVPHMIRAADDTEVWAASWDRVADDVFNLQSEIAHQVAESLGVRLAEAERTAIEERPTHNMEAYQAYLQARHWVHHPHFDVDRYLRGIGAFERAVTLDPSFARAWAELAHAHAVLRYYRIDLSPERLEKARRAAERAVALDSRSPRVHLELAYYNLRAFRDAAAAERELRLAEVGLAGTAELEAARGAILQVLGKWDEAIRGYQRALELSPRDGELTMALSEACWWNRRYPEALEAADTTIELEPTSQWSYMGKVFNYWSWTGDLALSRQTLESYQGAETDWMRWTWFWQEMFEKSYRDALKRLDGDGDNWIRTKMFYRPHVLFEAYVEQALNRPEKARSAFARALPMLREAVGRDPDNPLLHSSLGVALAGLGRREEAVAEGEKAVQLLPYSKDAVYSLTHEVDLAHIYTLLSDHEHAIPVLAGLLAKPSWVSSAFLRMDPRWRPLMSDPRMKQLLEP